MTTNVALQIFEAGFNAGAAEAHVFIDIDRKQLETMFNRLCLPLYAGPDQVTQLGGAPEDLRNFICAVFELYGMDGLTKVTDYVMKHRGTNAFTGKPL
jgi:hypothetical protein